MSNPSGDVGVRTARIVLGLVTIGYWSSARGGALISLVVAVKAYPTISDQHGEAVCVAGIRTDVDPPCWARLFPVPFRDLEPHQRFQKYDEIRLQVRRGPDQRPESWLPNAASIERIRHLSSSRQWEERRALVEPLLQPGMCEVRRQRKATGTSLAVIRPKVITDLEVRPAKERTATQRAITDQQSLLMPSREALEELPYNFRYHYRCAESGCNGHKQSVLD
jgi:hypothetical protein